MGGKLNKKICKNLHMLTKLNAIELNKKKIVARKLVLTKFSKQNYYEKFLDGKKLSLLNSDDIDERVQILQRDLLWLRIKKETNQDINYADIKMCKHIIAQLLSSKRRLQIEEGLDNDGYRREKSRKSRLNSTRILLK